VPRLHEVAHRQVRGGWTRNDWRRIDGGDDYGVESPEPVVEKVRRLPVQLDHVEPNATGHTTLAFARRMIRDGYTLENTIERTGWGRLWLAS
jgi:hypothetical protein